MRTWGAILFFLGLSIVEALADGPMLSQSEVAKILLHGPWPPAMHPDASNRVSGNPQAIAFGEQLFYEPRLSGTGSVLCATCHTPYRQFQDGRARAFGLEEVERNTPTLLDVRFNRRFGLDGANETLWAQSIRPLLEAREMRSSASHVASTVRTLFSSSYEKAFARPLPRDDGELLMDAGKALAAFQETLVSGRSAFDDFRDALERGDAQAMKKYPPAAKRGLRIFEGKGNCGACHVGARFNGERAAGEFRVPSLRNVALTAPYMHDGSLATPRDVVKHYSERLSEGEIEDIVAFLETLSQRQ